MIRIYYAHCMAIYHTPQEARDVRTLMELGLNVVNPNDSFFEAGVQQLKKEQPSDYMEYFKGIILTCEALAFRALPDGRIPAGVLKEIVWAREMGKLVIELPSGITARAMSLESTREYLREVGQR